MQFDPVEHGIFPVQRRYVFEIDQIARIHADEMMGGELFLQLAHRARDAIFPVVEVEEQIVVDDFDVHDVEDAYPLLFKARGERDAGIVAPVPEFFENAPKFHEKITVQTWPSAEKKLGKIRDFIVADSSGENIITASSQWILIDFHKKRPLVSREGLPAYQVIPERALQTDFPKIADVSRVDCRMEFNVRFDDIDFNKHVNNAVYPLWAAEAVGADFRTAHTPEEIEVAFEKECRLGEKVIVETERNGQISLHRICSLNDGRELARVKIAWKM